MLAPILEMRTSIFIFYNIKVRGNLSLRTVMQDASQAPSGIVCSRYIPSLVLLNDLPFVQ